MMIAQKMMKVTAKLEEAVIPDNHRVGIGLNTVPEPDELDHDAVFEAGDPPETSSAASTANDSMFEHVDNDVLVHFNLHYICMAPEMSSIWPFWIGYGNTRCFQCFYYAWLPSL
jgi:hypothetical protein